MLNIVWGIMLFVGLLCGLLTGRSDHVGQAVVESAGEAVTFAIGLIGICAFWCGMIRVLEAAGGLAFLQRLLKPLIGRIFPSVKKDPVTQQHILTNLTADFLGLGNGATPSGIAAVQGLSRLSGDGENASRDLCLFLVINSAALQLMPTTVVAMRAQLGSLQAADILIPTWLTSLGSLLVAVLFYRILAGRRGK